MTQEKDSTVTSGARNAPAEDGARAKKTPATRKTAAKKNAPATTEAKPAAKKPRATAKATAEPAPKKPATDTPAKTAKNKATAAKGAAPGTKEPQPAVPQTETAPKAAKTPAAPRKAPAKTRAAKTAAKTASAEPASAGQPAAAPAPVPASAEQKSPAPAAPSAGQASPEPVKAKPSRPNQRSRNAAARRAAKEKSAEKPVAASSGEQKPAAPGMPPSERTSPEPVKQPDLAVSETAASPEQPAAAQTGPGEGQAARPASRRSRRGGRRRNKNKTAALSAEANNGQAASTEKTAAGQPAPDDVAILGAPDTSGTAGTAGTAGAAGAAGTAGTAGAAGAADAPAGADAAPDEAPARPERSKSKGRQRESAPKQKREQGKDEAAEAEETPGKKTSSGKRKMFISVLSGELVEVVLAEDGVVLEYYVEMLHQAKIKGNIYKGVVSNIDANLQAAFVSYAGGVKNGFLQVDEVHPEYYQTHQEPAKNRKYAPIQKILKPGQEILVQVVKEPAGTKGAFLTSYLSLPGRFLVLTPGREQIGVSRKVDSDEERGRLRSMLEGLTPGKGLGVIVRTVSEGASKTSLQRDLQFLKRLWKEVRSKGQAVQAPSLIYEELGLSTRAVRDYLTDDIVEVWVDDAETARQVTELVSLLFPKKQNLVQVHGDNGHTLFERFSLQKQLDQINSREVMLPSGGRLVFDNTEALTAIDINSGRSSGKTNFEDMAFRTNLEAANAIPLQLRLRDIGGQVVVDFIEMRDKNHWRDVEKAVRNGMKGDRARYDVGKIGPFGMLEIVRQRLGSSAISVSTELCPCCKGTGIRRNMEWQAMRALRDIRGLLRQAGANKLASLTFHAETELAVYLLNAKRIILRSLEEEAGVSLTILPTPE